MIRTAPRPGYRLGYRLGCLSLVLLATFVEAQPATPRFDHITPKDGFSHRRIFVITQDSRGYLWFGTQDGLDRYDGYELKSFHADPADPTALTEGYITDLEEDAGGRLWVTTWTSGLHRFDPWTETFERFPHDPEDPSTPSPVVTAILVDSAGRWWLAGSGGIDELDPVTGTVIRHSYLELEYVGALVEVGPGELWVGSWNGLHAFDVASGRFERPSLPGLGPFTQEIGDMLIDRQGVVWIGSTDGVLRFDRKRGDLVDFRQSEVDEAAASYIFSLHEDRSGVLRIGSLNGLGRYRPETGDFLTEHHDPLDPDSLTTDMVIELYEDRSEILWLGTDAGVDVLRPGSQAFVQDRGVAARPVEQVTGEVRKVISLCEDRQGSLWVGTQGAGLLRLSADGRRTRFMPGPDNSISDARVWVIREDRRGRLWLGTERGLDRFDSERSEIVHFRHDADDPASLSDDRVLSLLEDGAGRLWVGTANGLNRLDHPEGSDAAFVHYDVPPSPTYGVAADSIVALHEDRSGTIWLGFSFSGLGRLDPDTGEIVRISAVAGEPGSLSADQVSAIYEDEHGEVLVASAHGGLDRWDEERGVFERVWPRPGEPAASVASLLRTPDALWLAADGGLVRFDPESGESLRWDESDGLLAHGFASRAAVRGRDGRLFFGGPEGLVTVFPERVVRHEEPPNVVLTDVRVWNDSVHLQALRDGVLELGHEDRLLTLDFAALHYADPEKNRYSYKLEGFDDDWTEVGASERSVRYSNLEPGDYTFRVLASNRDGVWSTEAASLAIVVRPAPWKTWWAYLLYGLAFFAVLTAFVRLERGKVAHERAVSRRLREVDRMKDAFLANTSHELRTPLYGMVGLAEAVLETRDLSPGLRSNLKAIVASGYRLASLVDDILDISKIREGRLVLTRRMVDVHAAADVVITLSQPLVAGGKVTLHNLVPVDLPPVYADENRLLQIFHNLVGNAVKFTPEGRVEISARLAGELMEVSVRDTGVGIAPEDQEKVFSAFEQADSSVERAFGGTGLGLSIVRQLVELHGGTIGVEAALGQGSCFTLTLPLADEGVAPEGVAPEVVAPAPSAEVMQRPLRSAPPVVERQLVRAVPESNGEGHILVVDDEVINRLVLSEQLLSAGYSVTEAADGLDALEILKEESFDMVLLDVMMPRMSGYDVCRKIRRRYSAESLPVLFLTARSGPGDLLNGFANGGNDYLTKPVVREELLSRVGAHLELVRNHRRLASMLDEQKDLLADLATFNAMVSHDLRNPLVTLKNYLGMLRSDLDLGRAERVEADFEILKQATDKLDLLIKDLYEYSRLVSRSPERVVLALGSLVTETVEALEEDLGDCRISVHVAPNLPPVEGDRERLREVVCQLLKNAAKFSHDAHPFIAVAVRQQAGQVVCSVQDNGIGIAPSYQEKVFELFAQLDPNVEGTGVGLSLARRIVEIHGGHLWVESRGLDKGSVFCFNLPQATRKTRGGVRKAVTVANVYEAVS